MVVVIVGVTGGEGGEGKRIRGGPGEEKVVGEEPAWPVERGNAKMEHSSSACTSVVRVDRRIWSMLVSSARRVELRRGQVIVSTMEGVTESRGPRKIRRIKCKEECI